MMVGSADQLLAPIKCIAVASQTRLARKIPWSRQLPAWPAAQRPMPKYSKPISLTLFGSYWLRPSKMIGVLSNCLILSRSGLRNCLHSVTRISALAPESASYWSSTRRSVLCLSQFCSRLSGSFRLRRDQRHSRAPVSDEQFYENLGRRIPHIIGFRLEGEPPNCE